VAGKASRRLLAVAVTVLAVTGVAAMRLAAAEQSPEPRRHTVTIDATSYSPKTVTANVGDTITWVNKDLFPHTVTARNGRFDSGDIAAGKSWTYTVKADGLFAYFCTYHPTMKGTLRGR
jgi:plastocyanin